MSQCDADSVGKTVVRTEMAKQGSEFAQIAHLGCFGEPHALRVNSKNVKSSLFLFVATS